MGAKQSKRSVDISGKEAENAGEVAAAGAGGEGRMEAIADVDNLKPQLNGDAQHIQTPDEKTDKEKQLDIGTPENEKDAKTEKESAEKGEEKEESPASPVTNGDSEPAKTEKENGDPPAQEESKKPKKEKVKKDRKWSFRSISFSRKEKPKQEKKQKDEEAKTNGEPEKLPEEAAEAVAEVVEKATVEAKPETVKEEKTPETPVTEPITNGSTAESPKEETPAAPAQPVDRPEPKVTEPEHLSLNGLSLDTPKEVAPVESKPEEPGDPTPPAPAPEIPVKSEVCVEQVPTIESTPPPLPANPPPSSVASFAATTMAPELADDAALANLTDNAPPAEIPAAIEQTATETSIALTDIHNIPLPSESKPEEPAVIDNDVVPKDEIPEVAHELANNVNGTPSDVDVVPKEVVDVSPLADDVEKEVVPTPVIVDEALAAPLPEPETIAEIPNHTEQKTEIMNDNIHTNGVTDNANHITENGVDINGDDTEHENLKNKAKDSLANVECNGNIYEDTVKDVVKEKSLPVAMETQDSVEEAPLPPPEESQAEENSNEEASESFPLPPSELCPSEAEATPEQPSTPDTQDALPIHDKMADLIPEVPDLPTETAVLQETASDVAVAN